MRGSAVSVVLGAALVAVGGGYLWHLHAPRANPAEQWALFGKYCTDCHNRDDFTAKIAFDRMTPESIAAEPEIFEAAVRKLRGGQMPPPGAKQFDVGTRRQWVGWLEHTLDTAAAQKPQPGRVALHRLNRTEYANAVAD